MFLYENICCCLLLKSKEISELSLSLVYVIQVACINNYYTVVISCKNFSSPNFRIRIFVPGMDPLGNNLI